MRTVQVTTPTGHTITVLARMHIYDIIRMYPDEFPSDGHPFIVCTVNNELTSLSEKVGVNCTLVPYSVATTDGAECYRRSLIFALGKVWSELFPQDSLQISHSQGHSYYLYVDNSSKNLQMEDIKTTDICAHGPKEDANHDVCITNASSMFFSNDKHITEEIVTNLRQELNLLIKANRPISSNIPMNANDLETALESVSDYNSVALLKSLNEVRVMTVRCDDYVQIYHTPLAPVTGLLKYYDLHTYKDGFVISFPSKRSPTELIPFKPNELLHDVYSEYTQWIRVLKVRTIGHLNNLCYKGMIKSFIQICETMQNKKLAELCDVIANNREYLQQYQKATRAANYTLGMSLRIDGDSGVNSRSIKVDSKTMSQELVDARVSTSSTGTSDSEVEPGMLTSAEVSNCYAPVSNIEDKEIKVVFISGPSSSGKTTFAKKLAYNLKVMGREPLIISLDNYFVDREKTPLAEDGSYDFEHVNALDLDLFNDHLEALISGKKILSPIFDFRTGTRKQSTIEMIMPFRGIIIIEGIHALNPLLSRRIPLPNKILVFIAPFTAINMDDRMRISSRDCRLIRRIVRDNNFRGFTAEKTIELLKNLRVGEDRWIYPHQHRADIMFNTALDYELCVLNTHAYPLLCEIKPDSSAYKEARQLIALLEKVASINSEFVPKFSLLREFIGGSGMPDKD
ncbi:Uridine kinase [Giardia duodenalis]|uniref:Uridine kinase n=1 Tax=Giardia intestinalis (strain ATCC 50803 / WB clone C6) TaxID=184922 RepID=A8BIZ7_GIAIC|nr:Uridine kinase [Giardia intestinalis]KAE8304897.1 Uridine kinase [Giardia intestinalis]|eukprot:XP_001706712.1 Uridine kinase [Giardia lamblia ATCC 50803]